MLSDIHMNLSNFGQSSSLADCLVIELSENLIQFCEIQTEENTPLYVCHYPIENNNSHSLSEHLIIAIKHFQLSKKSYQHIYVNYFNKQFTLCPTVFHEAKDSRTFLEFNVGNTENKIIFTDDINTDIKLIYAIDESLKSTLDLLYPNHQLKHTITVLSRLLLQSEELIKENILLSVYSNHIEITVKQDQQLVLANQFDIKTQEDILYYILFILEQYQLNPLTAHITIAGNIDVTSTLISSLKKYIKNIRLSQGHKKLKWSNVAGMPQHFNYTLLNRLFCE